MYHVPPEKTSDEVVHIEKIVLEKLIVNTQKRLETIKQLADQSDTPDMWQISIQMETATLASLQQELEDL